MKLYTNWFLLLFSLGCSGCSLLRISSLTESPPLNIPSHTGRNQFATQVGYGGKRGFDGSVSYSVSSHIAIGGSLFSNQQTFQDNPLPGWSSGYSLRTNSLYGEGQLSYFRTINQSVWAVTGGFGNGYRQIHWLENQLDSRFSRYFVQASHCWTVKKNRQIGIGAKLHYTNYASARLQELATPTTLVLAGHRGLMGVDIAQTIRLPLSPTLAFKGQVGLYFPLGNMRLVRPNELSNNSYINAGLIATVGLALSLPAKW